MGALIAGALLAACGQNIDTPLPEIPVKNAAPANGERRPLTPAEQKQAIDGMIAKRSGNSGQ